MQANPALLLFLTMSLALWHAPPVEARESVPGRCEPNDKDASDRPQLEVPAKHIGADARQTSPGTTYYVAPYGDDRWSGRLPEANATHTDGPVASLGRARDLARADRQRAPTQAATTIMLRGGRYQLSQPVVFSTADAGIRIIQYAGESPILTGAETLRPLKSKRGVTIAAPSDSDPGRDIFIGDARYSSAVKARADDPAGWISVPSPQPGNSFAYRVADLAGEDLAPGTMIELIDRDRSYDIATRISTVDRTAGVATVATAKGGPIENIESFRLIGRPEWVTKPGRFAWNRARRQLIVSPVPGSSALTDGVRLPRLSSLLVFRHTDHITVSGLKFVETRIADRMERDSASIVVEDAHDMALRDNQFHNVGQAIRLIGSSRNTLIGNHITETGTTGIELQDNSDGNLLSGNELVGIGRTDRAATAIYLHGASANRIAGNLVMDVARHGIGIDSWDDQTANFRNIVEENQIWKTSRTSLDSGAIEMLGRNRKDTSSIIRFNDIRDTHPVGPTRNGSRERLASGIYLDDFTSGVLICGNRISGSSLAAVQVHGGSNVSISDNLVLLDRPDAVFVFSQSADANEEGQRFDFKLGATSAAAASADHTITVTFDNDAVVGHEDRDLFVSKIAIGTKPIPSTDPSVRYLITDGRNLPGQVAMPWNGTLRWSVPQNLLASETSEMLSVYAWSNPAGGIGGHFSVAIDGQQLGDAIAGPSANRMANNIVSGNVVYTTAKGSSYFKQIHADPPSTASNTYIDKTASRSDPQVDGTSVVAEPGFVDANRGDFRLSPSSPLLTAGFRDLPFCLSEKVSCLITPGARSAATRNNDRHLLKLGLELPAPFAAGSPQNNR